MDLKSMLNEQIQSEEQESNWTEETELIRTLNLEISKLQSEKQTMLQTLKEQDERLKEQTRYVEQSKKNEKDNKRLLNEVQKALNLANNAKRQAEEDRNRAEQAKIKEREAHNKRWDAERKAREKERSVERSKLTYKSLFIGQMVFSLAIAILIAISKREVLRSMVSWFTLMARNIGAFFSWIAMRYMAAIQLQGKWAYLITTILFLAFFVGLFFVARLLIIKIKGFVSELRLNCLDTTLKDVITGDIALISLYICLFFADPTQVGNVFSLWLLMSMIGIVVWYMPQIIEIMKEKFKL